MRPAKKSLGMCETQHFDLGNRKRIMTSAYSPPPSSIEAAHPFCFFAPLLLSFRSEKQKTIISVLEINFVFHVRSP
jgi:hypothetical protein